jgi:hypothetical protein
LIWPLAFAAMDEAAPAAFRASPHVKSVRDIRPHALISLLYRSGCARVDYVIDKQFHI